MRFCLTYCLAPASFRGVLSAILKLDLALRVSTSQRTDCPLIRPKPPPTSDKATAKASSVKFGRGLILDAGGDHHAITILVYVEVGCSGGKAATCTVHPSG